MEDVMKELHKRSHNQKSKGYLLLPAFENLTLILENQFRSYPTFNASSMLHNSHWDSCINTVGYTI